MSIIGEIIGVGAVIGIALMIAGKLLPNKKLIQYGYAFGAAINVFGNSKLGAGWEKIEDFLVNSLGKFLEGVKAGLDPKNEVVIKTKISKRKVRK